MRHGADPAGTPISGGSRTTAQAIRKTICAPGGAAGVVDMGSPKPEEVES